MTELLEDFGVSLPQTHRSDTSAWQFVESIDLVLKKELIAIIKECPFFGISLDESTSQNVKKYLSIDLHVYRPKLGKFVYMLDFVEVPDCTAAGLIAKTKQVLEAFEAPMTKLTGAATDGASVFTGKICIVS